MKRLGGKTRRLITTGRKEGRKYIEQQKFTILHKKISVSISPLII
jgi:hypothetical protein